MLTSTRLFRFLLSLVIRLRWSFRRTALALRARFASLWRAILTFAQSQIRSHANYVPVAGNNPMGERPQFLERAKMEEEGSGTLAALPVRGIAHWQNELSRFQALTSSDEFECDPIPATPASGSQRYVPRTASRSPDSLKIPAGQQTLLSALPPLPDEWRRLVHPEGNVYFYHEGLRIFTESDIIHRGKEILFCATTLIQQAINKGDIILDELTEIVLNVEGNEWYYYFVDHTHRLLFWIHPVDAQEDLGTRLQGINGYSHIRYLVEAQYWYYIVYDVESRSHCEYYPHDRALPKKVFEDLRGRLNFAKTDMITADSSTSPFTQDELVTILDLINSLKDDGKIADPYSIWVTARLMMIFTEDQFLNFCGQPHARLNADTPLFEQQTWNRSIVFKSANVFLLWQLNEHAVRLKRVWVDGIIIHPRWKDFISRITAELGRYTIFSTVMLAVNFSFLAVPGVVTTDSPASSIQIIIYCSVVLTVASIVFSLALLSVYSDPGFMHASPAADVMKVLSQRRWGMACLAITHSLPIACLIWSILLFFVAFAVQIFLPKELPTVTTLVVESFILVILGIITFIVMRLFYRNGNVGDVGVSVQNDPPARLKHDV